MFGRGAGADRIAYFSDAVFAIAMTILVVDLRIPEGSTDAWTVVQEEWPSYFAFALSFVIIALSWVSHHRRFRWVREHDTGLIWINLVLLFFIVSVPFPTAMLADFADQSPAVALYALVVALIMIMQIVEWTYLYRRGMLDPLVDDSLHLQVVWAYVPTVVVFLVSIPIAFLVGPQAAMYFWLVQIPLGPIVGRLVDRALDRRFPDQGPVYGGDRLEPTADQAVDAQDDETSRESLRSEDTSAS